jgi:hypothetical protein
LEYHFETQPLPTVLGWWAHQSPTWLKSFSTAFVLVVEAVVPFFIWAPRRLRLVACALLLLFQILIALTGNYCFFNLLTVALCLLLIDDASFPARRGRGSIRPLMACPSQNLSAVAILILTLPINAMLLFSAYKPEAQWPKAVAELRQQLEPFHIVNGYGLFRVMTKTRPEIVIEGSADGIDWLPYKFKWKPGDVQRAPRWVAPHQPRLDWQMWFAALGGQRENQWFLRFAERLLRNAPPVLGLLEHNPFPDAPPRYLRAILYDYSFSSTAERRATGAWWKRRELREYLSTVSLHEM